VYDYALSAEEVAYLASDGDGCLTIPLPTDEQKANLYSSGILPRNEIVNFYDFAVLAQQWRLQTLWP
jgi:hypothetical protein